MLNLDKIVKAVDNLSEALREVAKSINTAVIELRKRPNEKE